MKIAVVGAGRMGSALAYFLSRGGHALTMVARGERLEALQKGGAIEGVDGTRAMVTAVSSLEPTIAFDLVMVTVLAHQVDALLPSLKASAAKKVMFLFNTVAPLAPLRDAVGAERFEFGFPSGFSQLLDGKLKASFSGPGQEVTCTSTEWAAIFEAAKIPSVVQPDMESFLRSHAAFVIPLMVLGCRSFTSGRGATMAESSQAVRVMHEGFAVVSKMGNKRVPGMVAAFAGMPGFLLTPMVWMISRTQVQKDLGSFGPGEVRALIDAMSALAPELTGEMRTMRP